MTELYQHWIRLLAPEMFLAMAAFIILGLSALKDPIWKRWIPFMSVLSCALTLVALLSLVVNLGSDKLSIATSTSGFGGMFLLDMYSIFFKVLFLLAAILTILVSERYLDVERAQSGEYYALILFAVLGMMFLASAGDFLVLFVALETMALSFYILVGYLKVNRKSNEGALKYFLLGSFSTGILLYGISLIYGTTGALNFKLIGSIRSATALQGDQAPFFMLGVILVTVGLGFKIAAVPFHMWAPDAYEGAPTPITAFLSTASKAAAFVVMVRIFVLAFGRLESEWAILLAILSVASMTVGNIAALLQDNIKRMLAYSSIAHAGYALIGVIAIGLGKTLETKQWGMQAVILYLFIYSFVNLGIFALVIMLRREQIVGDRLSDFAGLARRAPLSAFGMLVLLLSLAGIPTTAGFVGKWYLFGAAVRADYTWLAVVAVINSAISLYYYARVVVMMYMREAGDGVKISPSFGQRLAITACIAFTIFFGIYPQPILTFARNSLLVFVPWAL